MLAISGVGKNRFPGAGQLLASVPVAGQVLMSVPGVGQVLASVLGCWPGVGSVLGQLWVFTSCRSFWGLSPLSLFLTLEASCLIGVQPGCRQHLG